jgi:NAD(P)-dependent dehydrogenase (short-subunit alcohol dehydrogenase family)
MRLAGKVAIVTGATMGIGRATAVALAREGAAVVATGRNTAEGEITARQIEAFGTGCYLPQDVADEARWFDLVETVQSRFGALDVLVNNAGAFFLKPIEETRAEEFDAIYRVNVEGTFLGMKQAMAAMRGRGGSIVNVSSLLGKRGFATGTAYCATKAAVTQMTYAAALEGAPHGIRVNVIHPGVFWTRMLIDQFGDVADVRTALAADAPLGRNGDPAEIAGAVVYLASDEARFVTGSEITIDGGRGAR